MARLWGAFGLGGVALFMLLGFFTADVSGAPALLAFLLTVVLPAGGAGLLVRAHLADRRRALGHVDALRLDTLQAEVLRLAGRRGGRLAVVEVMSELAVDHDTAEAVLKRLHARELAELEITDAGDIIYAFPAVRRLPDKDSARGLLDA